jgi:hypothetical protein
MRNLAMMWVLAACLLGCGVGKSSIKSAPPSISTFTDKRDGVGTVIDKKEITDAKGFALCRCFRFLTEEDSLSIIQKDVSYTYFTEFSTLSIYQMTAIRDFVEQNIMDFNGESWQTGCNLITYACWSLYESDELDLFVKILLKKDGTLSEKDTSGCCFRLTGNRSRASVRRVVIQNITPLRHAYNERQRENPDSSNEVSVEFAVDEFGKVISARVSWTKIDDWEFIHFVENSVETWDFGKIDKAGDTTKVTYRLRFEQ